MLREGPSERSTVGELKVFVLKQLLLFLGWYCYKVCFRKWKHCEAGFLIVKFFSILARRNGLLFISSTATDLIHTYMHSLYLTWVETLS